MEKNLEALKQKALACTACQLCQGRHNVVFGVGQPDVEVMFIGEGPGENEDLQGEPFVGRGGQMLDRLLAVVDLDRNRNIYIANIVKCRPPHNRDPLPQEQECCIGYLRSQVAIIRPKILVCLGRIAACRIISPDFRVTKQHGQWFVRNGVHMMGTYHPASLLRNPRQKPECFEDFLGLRDKIIEICTHTYPQQQQR